MLIERSPSSDQSSLMVLRPAKMITKRPTNLELKAHDSRMPVASNQTHHDRVNALCLVFGG